MAKEGPSDPTDASRQSISPLLVVFDFDHTLIDCNSDLVPFNQLPYCQLLMPRFASLRKEQGMGWTQIMQTQLAELAAQEGYSKADLLACIRGVVMDPTLVNALRTLSESQKPPVKLVIASDANTVFIEEILAANGLGRDVFGAVYTNSGSWSAGDVLDVQPYQPVDTPHECPRGCPQNMCKTTILQRAARDLGLDRTTNLRRVYVGDGGNDFCPSLSLKSGNLVLAREGFALQRLIEKELVTEQPQQISETNSPEPYVPADQSVVVNAVVCGDSKVAELPRKVLAEVKLWQTHKQLGEILLDMVGEGRQQSQETLARTDAKTVVSEIEHKVAQMTIGKGSHI